MGRIDRVKLHRHIHRLFQNRIPGQGADDLLRRSDMLVEAPDQIPGGQAGKPGKLFPADPGRGSSQPQAAEFRRLFVVFRDIDQARGKDPRRHTRRQMGQIGLDQRALQIGQRHALAPRGPGPDARRHQSVARPARIAPSTEKLACHIRRPRSGAGGHSRFPPGSASPDRR